MRTALRILAVVLAIGGIAYWAAAGANVGWNKNQVQVKTLDEITGIEKIEWQDKFVPGFEFLSISVGAAALLGGISFLFRKPQRKEQHPSHT